jgi:hypothetical protein
LKEKTLVEKQSLLYKCGLVALEGKVFNSKELTTIVNEKLFIITINNRTPSSKTDRI